MSELKKLFEKMYIQNAPSWSVEQDDDGSYKYHATKSAFTLFEIQQAKINELTQTIVGIQGFLKDHQEEGLIEMAYHDDINQIIEDGEYVEKALRGEHD